MQIETLKIADLLPYKQNARKHIEQQIEKIAGSIRHFGFNNPILIDEENGIIAGHGRCTAATKLGYTELPCIRLSHLTEKQKKAFILADNRIAEVGGEWDKKLLKKEIESLVDEINLLDCAGFSDSEIEKIISADLDDENQKLDTIAKMELQPFEKHDYIMLIFDNDQEFSNACELFKIQKCEVVYSPKCKKVGLGRVIKGNNLFNILDEIRNTK